MQRQLVIGLGTGHCGLELLAEILHRQSHANVTFQQAPWLPWDKVPGRSTVQERMDRWHRTRSESLIGDVGHFYLPYAREFLELCPDARLICLQRPQPEVAAGFIHSMHRQYRRAVNHWSTALADGWDRDPHYSRTFPKFDITDFQECIGRYWTLYSRQAAALAAEFPDRFRLLDPISLTQEAGVRDLLDFCNVPRDRQVILTGKQPNLPPPSQPLSEGRFPDPLDPRRCVVLVPFSGFIHQECEQSLKELERRGYVVRRVGGYAAIDQGRNQMATDALLEGFEETLWIDSDIGFHPDDVDKLRRHQLPIVCGVYPQKGKRALACHVLPGTDSMTFGTRGGIQEILYAATGFLLIRRGAYLRIQEQLKLPMCNERFSHPMIPFFYPMIRPSEEAWWYLAEDYAFCHRARECGFRIWADTSIRLWHVGNYRYGWEDAGLQRQRTSTFTLRFSGSPQPSALENQRGEAGLVSLQEKYPWPTEQPRISRPAADAESEDLDSPGFKNLIPGNTSLILELGAAQGRGTRDIAEAAQQAIIIAVDDWTLPLNAAACDWSDMAADQSDTFLAECWELKDRVIPVQADPLQAIRLIAQLEISPSIAVIHATQNAELLPTMISVLLDLFPEISLLGFGAERQELMSSIHGVASRRGRTIEVLGDAWRSRHTSVTSSRVSPAR